MNEPESVRKNVGFIAEYGRYDDLFSLMGTPCEGEMLRLVKEQFCLDRKALEEENGRVSLLAKWLPSVNASSRETVGLAKKIAKALGLNEESYRKALTALRARLRILENNLRQRDYSFSYEKQPSRALFKYRKAFLRNDRERYGRFLEEVCRGEKILHAENVAPYELVEPYLITDRRGWKKCFMQSVTPDEKQALNAAWASLPDYGSKENALAVIDTSGSMYGGGKPLPAAVALSLGLYFAEHSTGPFRNCFIEFSARPRLIPIKGDTFADRLRYAASFNEIANTNLEAVWDLLLDAALKKHASQKELPAKLILISDMEFDRCVDHASEINFQNAKKKFAAHGYTLPQIVFWNVASRRCQQPVTENEQGVILVSGATLRIFSMIAGGFLTPYAFMTEVLDSERYAKIVA